MKTLKLILLPFLALTTGCGDGKTVALPIRHTAFSPDGKWLVAAGGTVKARGGEGIVKVWHTATWKPHDTWEERFTDRIQQVHFISKDVVATISNEMARQAKGPPRRGVMLRSWIISEKKELSAVHLSEIRWDALSIGYYPSENVVASLSKDTYKLAILTIPKLKEKLTLKEDARETSLLRFSPDGKRIMSAIRDSELPQLKLFDTSNGERVAFFNLPASKNKVKPTEVRSAQFSPNGKLVAVAVINPDTIYVLGSDLNAAVLTVDLPFPPDFVEFSPDSETIASKKDRDAVQLYSVKTKQPTKAFDGNSEGANCCCFSPDGVWIAIGTGGHPQTSGTSPGRVRVFEVKTGKLLAELD